MTQIAPLLELLKDVGRFVVDTLSTEMLSEGAAVSRETLVQRLKLYLPETFPPASPPPYLDMTVAQSRGNSVLRQVTSSDGNEYVGADTHAVEEYEEEYEECPETQPVKVASREEVSPPQSPPIAYNDLRASSPKIGPLHRFEKRFFRDQFRRYLAGINNHLLLFYEKDRDTKPAFVIDLVGFQARAAPDLVKDPKKKSSCFEIICPGKKTTQVQLIARTTKDMEQWVSAIGQAGGVVGASNESPVVYRRQLPSLPNTGDTLENYDDIASKDPVAVVVEEEEEIYHDISIVSEDVSDTESIYDDIATYSTSIYYNMGIETHVPPQKGVDQESILKQLPGLQSQPQPHPEEEQEEMYDDIFCINNTVSENEKPTLRNPLASKVNTEIVMRPHPTLQPHLPEGEEQEELYDDIPAFDDSVSKNVKLISSDTAVPKISKEILSTPPSSSQSQLPQGEEQEELYDDIPAFDDMVSKNTKPLFSEPSLPKIDKRIDSRSPKTVQPQLSLGEEQEELYDDIPAFDDTVSKVKKQISYPPAVPELEKEIIIIRPSPILPPQISQNIQEEELYDDISSIENINSKSKKPAVHESAVSKIAKEFSLKSSPVVQRQLPKKKEQELYGGSNDNISKGKKPILREAPGSKIHGHILNLEEVLGRGKMLRVTGLSSKVREEHYEPVDTPKTKPKTSVRPQLPTQRKLVR